MGNLREAGASFDMWFDTSVRFMDDASIRELVFPAKNDLFIYIIHSCFHIMMGGSILYSSNSVLHTCQSNTTKNLDSQVTDHLPS